VGFGMEKKKRWAKLSGCDGEGKEKMTECWELLSQHNFFFLIFRIRIWRKIGGFRREVK
jgi:hypothetical protein